MGEEQSGAAVETFTGRANVAILALAMVIEAACLGVSCYMLFVADGGWGWWILFAFGLLMGPGALLKYLSAARCSGDADQISGYMGKGFGSIPWSEVESVKVQASRLRVQGKAGQIVVNLAYLSNKQELKDYVTGRCQARGLQVSL